MMRRQVLGSLVLLIVLAATSLVAAASPVAAEVVPPRVFGAVAVGDGHSCALRVDETLACWGDDDGGEASAPEGRFRAIDLSDEHSCALGVDGLATCFGDDIYMWTDPPPDTFTSVSAGLKNGCGVRTDATLACWGYDYKGKSSPPPGTFRSVSAGFLHTCGLRTDSTVSCWGSENVGETIVPSGAFVAVSAGNGATCGIRPGGALRCWGSTYEGITSPPPGTYSSVSMGLAWGCAVRTDETLACWGSNWNGGATPPPGRFVSVSVGGTHTCAVATDGSYRCWGADTSAGELVGDGGAPPSSGFHAVTPTRLLDSRSGVGFSGMVQHRAPRSLQVTGRGGPSNVPATARAVVLNVTATDSTSGSFLTVHPSGAPTPYASNVNFGAGQVVPNLVTVQVGVGGNVDIATAVGSTHVVADLVGYYDNGIGPGDRFTPLASPVRLLDSRSTTGSWSGPLPAGPGRDLVVRQPASPQGVPATASAVVANITVTGSSAATFVSAWPAGTPNPRVSNLNVEPGQTKANLAVAGIGAGGSVRFANAVGTAHVIVDIVGYFDPTAGSRFQVVHPTRVLDTRVGNGLNGPQGPSQSRSLLVAGVLGSLVPDDATAVVANVTVADSTAETFVSVYPAAPRPNPYSTVNLQAGQVVPNHVMVGLATGGTFDVYNHLGSTALVADVVGYFVAS